MQTFKERFGYYPQEGQADKIYLNKENRKSLKNLGIVCHYPSLERPKKKSDAEEKKLRRKASGKRDGVKATFDTDTRIWANNIRAKQKRNRPDVDCSLFLCQEVEEVRDGTSLSSFEKTPQIATN